MFHITCYQSCILVTHDATNAQVFQVFGSTWSSPYSAHENLHMNLNRLVLLKHEQNCFTALSSKLCILLTLSWMLFISFIVSDNNFSNFVGLIPILWWFLTNFESMECNEYMYICHRVWQKTEILHECRSGQSLARSLHLNHWTFLATLQYRKHHLYQGHSPQNKRVQSFLHSTLWHPSMFPSM